MTAYCDNALICIGHLLPLPSFFAISAPADLSCQVDIPGPLGDNPADIIQALPRLATLNGSPTSSLFPRSPEWTAGEPLLERVLRAMWQHVQMYRLATEEQLDETAVWYVTDEVAAALRHSDAPCVATAPFLHMPGGTLGSAVR